MIEFREDKELFDFIRSAEIPQVPSLKEILSTYETDAISIADTLGKLRIDPFKVLLIDARSENEYAESEIPHAINFPVLTNCERHNVGLIYKKYSKAASIWLAMKYADPKNADLGEFLRSQNASDRHIIVYCWRGGGRSGYLAKMISDLGYTVSLITGGHKSFRRYVNEYFSHNEFSSGLLELTGMTGSGKTMLLREAAQSIPVIDLENSARHFSSLLGRVPYEVKGIPEVSNQASFENRVFADIALNMNDIEEKEIYLIESESKKVGDFIIPEILYNKMLTAPVIKVESKIENRVLRLNRDYFGENNEGIVPMKKIMTAKESFFKQQLSTATYDELVACLDGGDIEKFTEVMLVKYYDLKYKDKGKKPIAVVNADSPMDAVDEIVETYRNIKQDPKLQYSGPGQ